MPRYAESDLVPISALQHLIYCPRQCALIHNEQQWAENRLTVEGQQLHSKAHDTRRSESRPGVRIARGLVLRSFEHGLVGQADVVEFTKRDRIENTERNADADQRPVPGNAPGAGFNPGAKADFRANLEVSERILPIEYKRGKPKPHDADKVQLCAQALCLEEMLNLPDHIVEGRLFYGKTRRRQDVCLDDALRSRTLATITELHALFDTGQTPTARYEKQKCDRCSLIHLCMPKQLATRRTTSQFFINKLHEALV